MVCAVPTLNAAILIEFIDHSCLLSAVVSAKSTVDAHGCRVHAIQAVCRHDLDEDERVDTKGESNRKTTVMGFNAV